MQYTLKGIRRLLLLLRALDPSKHAAEKTTNPTYNGCIAELVVPVNCCCLRDWRRADSDLDATAVKDAGSPG